MTCPECGEPARGTSDYVPGCALFTEPDEDGEVEYSGSTDCYWDGQTNAAELLGDLEDGDCDTSKTRLQCDSGHEWDAESIDEDEPEATT